MGTDELLWLITTIGDGYGHVRSVRESAPVAADGSPTPWYTYPALEYLRQLDFSEWDVFEFGGGNSSKFWAPRCRSVTTVESDPAWYAEIVKRVAPTQKTMLVQDPRAYADAILARERPYDLIVIDGQYRSECARRAIRQLAPAGIILFDNSDWWPDTCAFLRDQGLLQVDFTGPGPINRYTWTTSLFFTKAARVHPLSGRQPEPGIASLRQVANPE